MLKTSYNNANIGYIKFETITRPTRAEPAMSKANETNILNINYEAWIHLWSGGNIL